jgi:hypothetical protein
LIVAVVAWEYFAGVVMVVVVVTAVVGDVVNASEVEGARASRPT